MGKKVEKQLAPSSSLETFTLSPPNILLQILLYKVKDFGRIIQGRKTELHEYTLSFLMQVMP